jgi:protein-S-isoprenylcysteine O-methyltransferase Ste14
MNRNIIRRLFQVLFTFLIQGSLLFLSAWSLRWTWAWVYLAMCIFILIINLVVIPAEVIEERGRKKKNVKRWDKILSAINIFPILGMYILSGFDYRLNWSIDLSVPIHIIALILFFMGAMLFTWSMASNKFFSTMVRIQTDREHKVVMEGPYNYVRHPGYVGFILMLFATPIALGSLYGIFMSGIVTGILMVRTALEDKTLRKELDGYEDYAGKIKYKLVPFIW